MAGDSDDMTIDISVPPRVPRATMTDQQRARLREKQRAKRAARDAAGFNASSPPAIMTPGQAAAYLTISVSSLARMRIDGNGPTYIQLTAQKIGYRAKDLDAYVESKMTTKTHGR